MKRIFFCSALFIFLAVSASPSYSQSFPTQDPGFAGSSTWHPRYSRSHWAGTDILIPAIDYCFGPETGSMPHSQLVCFIPRTFGGGKIVADHLKAKGIRVARNARDWGERKSLYFQYVQVTGVQHLGNRRVRISAYYYACGDTGIAYSDISHEELLTIYLNHIGNAWMVDNKKTFVQGIGE